MKMGLPSNPANARLGSSLVFSAAFAAIADKRIDTSAMNQTERMAAGVKTAFDELNEANFRIHNVLYGIIKQLLEQAVGGSLDSLAWCYGGMLKDAILGRLRRAKVHAKGHGYAEGCPPLDLRPRRATVCPRPAYWP
jgi:hypothetical protein